MRALQHLAVAGPFLLGLMLFVSGCASSLPQDQAAYNACTDTYNSQRQSVAPAYAFVSGVDDDDGSCYWHWGEPSAAAAESAAITECQKHYANCFTYATSDGWSPWVKAISDNGGRAQDMPQDISPECQMALAKEGVEVGADMAAVLGHRQAPYDGSDVDPTDCAQ